MGVYASRDEMLDVQLEHMDADRHDAVLDVLGRAGYELNGVLEQLERVNEYLTYPKYALQYLSVLEQYVEDLRENVDLLSAIEDGTAIWDNEATEWRRERE